MTVAITATLCRPRRQKRRPEPGRSRSVYYDTPFGVGLRQALQDGWKRRLEKLGTCFLETRRKQEPSLLPASNLRCHCTILTHRYVLQTQLIWRCGAKTTHLSSEELLGSSVAASTVV